MQSLSAALFEALPQPPRPPLRHNRRALRWREDIERATGAALAKAATRSQRDAVEAAHDQVVRRGPDFAKFRRGSTYATPVAVKDRNALDRLVRWFAYAEREAYQRDRASARHEGRTIRRSIPRTARPVLLALVALARKYGCVYPSIERLASMAQCCRRTAVACLQVLEDLGLITRHRRRKRITNALGVAMEVQDTNAYALTAPQPEGSATASGPGTGEKAKVVHLSGIDDQPSRRVKVASAIPAPAAPSSCTIDWRSRARAALTARIGCSRHQ